MSLVTLKSRIPQISAEMQGRLDAVATTTAGWVADTAKQLVPDAPPYGEGLVEAIHVENEIEGSYVVAGDEENFHGHFIENGTVRMPPRPFLVPAAEIARAPYAAAATKVLRGL